MSVAYSSDDSPLALTNFDQPNRETSRKPKTIIHLTYDTLPATMKSRILIGGLAAILLAALECCHALINSGFHKTVRRSSIHPRGSSKLTQPFGVQGRASRVVLRAVDDGNEEGENPKNKAKNKKKSKRKKGERASKKGEVSSKTKADEKSQKKAEIMQQLKAKLDEKKETESKNDGGLLGKLNPFQAGQNLRQTIGKITSLGSGLSSETKQKYYLDDRLLEAGGVLSERNPYLERLERDNFVPEVLVIGATGDVGRLVVRRLLLEGRFRVRVLVRDLYSQTLNLLGTGVTYCQGELGEIESLEYALTDVDKIVFCAAAPRADEKGFQEKFQNYMQENLEGDEANKEVGVEDKTASDVEWEKLSSVLEVRANLAEQVDYVGLKNLVTAYQNVRHADYGTSQAAKRSLFKFSGRPEDFNLFALDEDADGNLDDEGLDDDSSAVPSAADSSNNDYSDADKDGYDDFYDDKEDDDDDDAYYDELYNVESRRDANVKSQVKWIRNEFGNGVFVGNVPKEIGSGVGGEAAIVSSRLRSREEPENGIDLSGNFAGFVVRLVGDGGNYEAFVRTGSYEEDGIEYVCDFMTSTKSTSKDNKSRNKFVTARLSFDDFKPVRRKEASDGDEEFVAQPFSGSDVRNIGFRYRSGSNKERAAFQEGEFSSFYLALSYVKVYRLQPEPEFIYLSDARIPPRIQNGMVRHDRRELLLEMPSTSIEGGDDDVIQLLDEKTLASVTAMERSSEETYYKYRGEEVLKASGLR
jgi:hypothetical protein